jgi:hypothetical protein
MGNMAANPIYGIDPKKWAALFLKSKRLDPTDMQYTEEEQEKMAAAPPPEPPPVTVARINADTQIKLGVMKQTADQQTQQAEQRVADAANTLEGQKLHVQATVDLHEMEQKRQLAMLDYANRHQISLDQTKAELASTAMKLQVERELNAINNAIHTRDTHASHVVDVHKHAVDTAEAARQHAVDTDHAAVTHALDSVHAARQADQQTAEQRRQHTIDTGSDLFKHQNPPPAVQVPGKAAAGQAASQVNP